MVEVPVRCQLLEFVPVVQMEGCLIVLNHVKVHSPAEPALCILYDLLNELASYAKVPILFCDSQCQNIHNVFLVKESAQP